MAQEAVAPPVYSQAAPVLYRHKATCSGPRYSHEMLSRVHSFARLLVRFVPLPQHASTCVQLPVASSKADTQPSRYLLYLHGAAAADAMVSEAGSLVLQSHWPACACRAAEGGPPY